MALTLALILDAVFGEPRWLWSRLPHPAVLMGRCVSALDNRLNRGAGRRARGLLALAILLFGAIGLGLACAAVPGWWLDALLAAILLAQRSLVDHVRDVAAALDSGIDAARRAVGRIVGRDTAEMDEAAIARAAIESAAENFSDGVLAPAFWFALAGLPGILAYKVVNTADSMIGYRTPRHEHFGWAAARLDDVLNWVPARLAALALFLARPRRGAWAIILRDAPRHRSPNAGWPEAAMAAALNVALAGPRRYAGTLTEDAFVNPGGRQDVGAAEIRAACAMLWRAWAILLAVALCGGLLA